MMLKEEEELNSSHLEEHLRDVLAAGDDEETVSTTVK